MSSAVASLDTPVRCCRAWCQLAASAAEAQVSAPRTAYKSSAFSCSDSALPASKLAGVRARRALQRRGSLVRGMLTRDSALLTRVRTQLLHAALS